MHTLTFCELLGININKYAKGYITDHKEDTSVNPKTKTTTTKIKMHLISSFFLECNKTALTRHKRKL